jgi:hypothetical protein
MPDVMMDQLTAQQTRRARQMDTLWKMSPEERRTAMCRGELTTTQLLEWAAHRPDEVPLIEGEFKFIAALTPEVADIED